MVVYENYYNSNEISTGISNGSLLVGRLCLNKKNSRESYVRIDSPYVLSQDFSNNSTIIVYKKDVFLPNQKDRNRSFEGDYLVVEVYDRSKWNKCTNPLPDCSCSKSSFCRNNQPCGTVVGILKREKTLFPCSLELSTKQKSENGIAKGISTYDPESCFNIIETELDITDLKKNSIYLVELVRWDVNMMYPQGRLLKKLGELNTPSGEVNNLLAKFDLLQASNPFPDDVVRWCDEESKKLRYNIENRLNLEDRLDLSSLRIVTIDPPSAKDLDDAIHIRILKEDYSEYCDQFMSKFYAKIKSEKKLTLNDLEKSIELFPKNVIFEIGVHIADVSSIITSDCIVEEYLQNIPCTIYFPHLAIHMLPSVLSENVFSLNSGKDCASFSVLMYLNRSLELINLKYHKSIIHVTYSLSYPIVQNFFNQIIDFQDEISDSNHIKPNNHDSGDEIKYVEDSNNFEKISNLDYDAYSFDSITNNEKYPIESLQNDLLLLLIITFKMNNLRQEKGQLEIENTQLNIVTDKETGYPINITQNSSNMAQKLIAELMLLCNRCVAEELVKYYPECAILRVHRLSNNDKLHKLQLMLSQTVVDYPPPKFNNINDFTDYLNVIKANFDTASIVMLENLITFFLEPAEYALFSKSKASEDPSNSNFYGHFALNFANYTHFTSPIRRYSDIIAHRQLYSICKIKNKPLSDFYYLQEKVESISKKCLNAKYVSEEAFKSWLHMYIHKLKKPVIATGVVKKIMDKGVEIFLLLLKTKLNLEFYCVKNNARLKKIFYEDLLTSIDLPTEYSILQKDSKFKITFDRGKSVTYKALDKIYVYLLPKKSQNRIFAILPEPKR